MYIVQLVNIVVILIVFIYASCLDIKTRTVPFKTWYPLLLVCPFLVLLSDPDPLRLSIALIISGCFYATGYFKLIGGADAWAMIFVTLFMFLPLKLEIVDLFYIILQTSIIGIVTIVGLYIWKRKWYKIPYIPAITCALSYFLFFGLLPPTVLV